MMASFDFRIWPCDVSFFTFRPLLKLVFVGICECFELVVSSMTCVQEVNSM